MSERIYVASSWRNAVYPSVVANLRAAGHEVYDFRDPSHTGPHAGQPVRGFAWSEIDPEWQSWTPVAYREALDHPIAWAGFERDHAAMEWATAFVLVLPCGRSAHTEAGWACGRGKPTHILLYPGQEPELMYREVLAVGGRLVLSLSELLAALGGDRPSGPTFPRSGYDIDAPHAWLNDREIEMYEAVNAEGADTRITVQLPGGKTVQIVDPLGGLGVSPIDRALCDIARLRRDLHAARGGAL